MNFDAKAHNQKMKPHVDKLVAFLRSKGVTVEEMDGNLENFVFTYNKTTARVSHHNMYRHSGIACFSRDKGENFTESVDVTDDMYMNMVLKPCIKALLDLKE